MEQELRRYHDALPEASPEAVGAARSRLAVHMQGVGRAAAHLRGAGRTAGHLRDGRAGHLRGARRPWSRVWRLSLAGAAAALVAAAVIPGFTPEAPRTLPSVAELRPVADARDLADNAAVLASGEPEWNAGPQQWGYVKSLRARTRTDGGEWLRGRPKATHTHEQWRRLDDTAFATVDKGKLRIHRGSEFEVSYPYLLALPTDADQLLARIYETVDAENARNRASLLRSMRERAENRGKTPEEARRLAEKSLPRFTSQHRDRWAFQLIALGMGDAALPPRLRAAMYGAMARIPGVGYEDTASDLLKRRGITLYHVMDGYLRDEIFIDPETYEYLGYRTIVVKDHRDGPFGIMKMGEIHRWDALIEAAVVGKAGQRPG